MLFVITPILGMAMVVTGCGSTLKTNAPDPGPGAYERVHQKVAQEKAVQTPVVPVVSRLFTCNGVGPDTFNTKEQCSGALTSGGCTFGLPKHFGNRNHNHVNGKSMVLVEEKKAQCVQTDTGGEIKWMPQQVSTVNRYSVGKDGKVSPIPHAWGKRDSHIFAVVVPIPEVQPTAPVTPPAPVVIPHVAQEKQQNGDCFTDERGHRWCPKSTVVVEESSNYSWVLPLAIAAVIAAVVFGGGSDGGGGGSSATTGGGPVNPPISGGPVSPPI